MDNIILKPDDIANVKFAKNVHADIHKTHALHKHLDIATGEIKPMTTHYKLQFNLAGATLPHIINQAKLQTKTNLRNYFAQQAEKDVEKLNNDTFDMIQLMKDETGLIVLNGMPRAFPDAPPTVEGATRLTENAIDELPDNEKLRAIEAMEKQFKLRKKILLSKQNK